MSEAERLDAKIDYVEAMIEARKYEASGGIALAALAVLFPRFFQEISLENAYRFWMLSVLFAVSTGYLVHCVLSLHTIRLRLKAELVDGVRRIEENIDSLGFWKKPPFKYLDRILAPIFFVGDPDFRYQAYSIDEIDRFATPILNRGRFLMRVGVAILFFEALRIIASLIEG